MSMDGFKEELKGWIVDFSQRYCADHGVEPIWREPLVGLADAESPMFPELKVIAHPSHKVPQDYLPGAKTVVSYFLPFRPAIPDNNAGGRLPTKEWAEAYKLTNSMAKDLSRHIADRIIEKGHRAVAPEDFTRIIDRTYSCWSQRHVARIAGLGNFGINCMLITDSGCGGRFFSVVTDMPCEHDAPDLRERCLYKIDGSCGRCARACIVGAVSGEGFDRDVCEDQCNSNIAGFSVSVCGKCLSGMPCTFRDPSSRP